MMQVLPILCAFGICKINEWLVELIGKWMVVCMMTENGWMNGRNVVKSKCSGDIFGRVDDNDEAHRRVGTERSRIAKKNAR